MGGCGRICACIQGGTTARVLFGSVGCISAVHWFVVVAVGRLCAMLLPQPLFLLVACCGATTKVVPMTTSPALYTLELSALKGRVGLVYEGWFVCCWESMNAVFAWAERWDGFVVIDM